MGPRHHTNALLAYGSDCLLCLREFFSRFFLLNSLRMTKLLDLIFFVSFLLVVTRDNPAGDVCTEAAAEVDACGFYFLRVWRVEIRGIATASVTGFNNSFVRIFI